MDTPTTLTLAVPALSLLAAVLTPARPTAPPLPAGQPTSALERRGVTFAVIPAGDYAPGCAPGDTRCEDDEAPRALRDVTAFALARTETRRADYQRCVDDGACAPPAETGWCGSVEVLADDPVSCVSYEDARAFCGWLGGRLPTAAEWEYAARGGQDGVYPWGDAPPDEALARYGGLYDGPDAVGAHPANGYGLYDMAGNVREWTASTYAPGLVEVRGGGWNNGPRQIRTSNRAGSHPKAASVGLGFRCAADL